MWALYVGDPLIYEDDARMILGDTRLLQVDLRSHVPNYYVLGTWLLANCSTNLGQLQEHWPLRALGLRV